MNFHVKLNAGKKALVFRYRKAFRVPENLDFYSRTDFEAAERKFVKYAMDQGLPLAVTPGKSSENPSDSRMEP